MPREPSAAPFHDWNARIHAECYRANAYARIHDSDGRIQGIVNNYERISFNFGPTLARWLGRHDPDVAERLRAADAAQLRRLGHGGAVAQAYAHPIVPLCNAGATGARSCRGGWPTFAAASAAPPRGCGCPRRRRRRTRWRR